jgi:predicted TIM-barrel fold metal-dependent hydrolase
MRAIDIHLHPGITPDPPGIEELAEIYRRNDVVGLPIAWDEETRTGRPPLANDFIARMIREYPDVFIGGWACVDPWKGQAAIREAERAVKELGLLGLKFQQDAQRFFPNDRRFYPLWEKCVELECPVMFHMGTTGYGVGQPGGGGIKLKYARPIPYLDDVAADFPQLTIVGAHPAWPWQDEMLAIVIHKSNVFIDLSGWSPKYFPEALKREVNGRLQDRALFGSDHPFIPLERWLADFEKEGYKPEVVEKILYRNAQTILGLKV